MDYRLQPPFQNLTHIYHQRGMGNHQHNLQTCNKFKFMHSMYSVYKDILLFRYSPTPTHMHIWHQLFNLFGKSLIVTHIKVFLTVFLKISSKRCHRPKTISDNLYFYIPFRNVICLWLPLKNCYLEIILPWEYWQHSTTSCVEKMDVWVMLDMTLSLASFIPIEEKA